MTSPLYVQRVLKEQEEERRRKAAALAVSQPQSEPQDTPQVPKAPTAPPPLNPREALETLPDNELLAKCVALDLDLPDDVSRDEMIDLLLDLGVKA